MLSVGEKLYETIRQLVTINLLFDALTTWAELTGRSIIIFIDEIDTLIGDSLLSVLRQIRAGYNQRPKRFAQTLCLIVLRDMRDYRIWSKQQDVHLSTSSSFNIKAESLTLSNFSKADIKLVYSHHTQATGQYLPTKQLTMLII